MISINEETMKLEEIARQVLMKYLTIPVLLQIKAISYYNQCNSTVLDSYKQIVTSENNETMA